jgi:hypothetical protein
MNLMLDVREDLGLQTQSILKINNNNNNKQVLLQYLQQKNTEMHF